MRVAFIVLVAILTTLPFGHGVQTDRKLSPEFQEAARDYLKYQRECWDSLVRDDVCADDKPPKKAQRAATTPGDKALLLIFDEWEAYFTLGFVFVENRSKQTLEQRSKEIKHEADVCNAELQKALKDGVAPEKSECEELINPKQKPSPSLSDLVFAHQLR